ncbi:type IV secretion system protein [Advenella sp. EE-W14]|uniref:type IV secretion system protein n=1 Tax=Advenella sp. EE-W14 TaxID=2722705 RepID=UPI0020070A9C|nr:type IV secretion system protein [Advenella sp. EE-W14]
MAFDASKINAPTDANRIGEWLMKQVDTVLNNAVNTPIEQLIKAIAPAMIIGLTLQFLFYAYAMQRGNGNMTVTEFVHKYIKIAILAAIITAGGVYQTTIVNVMLSLPDDVAGIVAGGNTLSAQIDSLRQDTTSAASKMIDLESSFFPSSRNVVISLYASALSLMTSVISAVVSIIMVVVKVGMALLVAAGPIFISALAFERTEKLFDSWVSQALNFVFLALLAGLMFAILLQMNLAYVKMMIETLAQGEINMLNLVGGYMFVGIASVFVMLMIPGMAQGLSGGFGAQFGIGMAAGGVTKALRLNRLLRKK